MSFAYDEITSQPESWRATIPAVREQWDRITSSLAVAPETHFLFIGSGSSLYISQVAAQSVQEITGLVAAAIPSSDVFLSAGSTVPRGVPVVAFVISRSGRTSEALRAAEYVRDHCPNVTTVGVTCYPESELEQRVEHVIVLPHAAEQSVVMTRSFSSMLIALQTVGALVAGDAALLDELPQLPDLLEACLPRCEEFGRTLGTDLERTQFIFLGLGPNYGIGQEATLKLKEMTQTVCEGYGPLEFRHGPISVVDDSTAVVVVEGERERAYLPELETELKQLGARVAVVAPFQSSNADVALHLPGNVGDVSRCALYLPALQFIAYHRALALGLDPDRPRHLTQVVELSA
jgi:glucosamine--fructose-6-phosphate aminotransferase (isomerizing)